jgi:hypothetical protein
MEVIVVLGFLAAKGASANALAFFVAFGGVVARVYGPVAIGAAAAWGVAAVLVSRWRRRALAAAESFAVASDSPDALR